MSQTQALNEKVAVVTGAGRGIGRSIARTFALSGADVAICARSAAEISTVAAEIEAMGRRCLAVAVDLSSAKATVGFCSAVKAEFDGIDIIVNNAGVYLERGVFAESDAKLWWKTMEVNVRAPYLITRHLLSSLRKGSKIINLTSGKGFTAGTNSSAYHVSKAALNMLTNALANELWQREVEVNHLVPGPTATATFDNPVPGRERSPEEILSQEPDSLPKGLPAWERVKHPNEVAALALRIATQAVGGPTGQVFSLARRPL